ncbi:hypothetical protein FACS1894208_08310 [Clostridia bacterium]|nr:hypothetical protein FACS1894208_08310 [Clostridia bacterium]
MRMAICDDEMCCVDVLAALLREYAMQSDESFELDGYTSGTSFLDNFRPNKYDIILDLLRN